MKKLLLSLVLVVFGVVLLAGCDEIKQVISDVAEETIEDEVNTMLGLEGEDELFQLPEAKRYESFNVVKDEEDYITGLSFDVIEPSVTVEDYAKEMINTFAKGFEDEFDEEELQTEIDKIKENGEWSYEYDGDVYKVTFDEIMAADGETVEKWAFAFEVIYGDTETGENTEGQPAE